jgi:hypothetical protein
MRAHEFVVEKKKRKRRPRYAAYGPGPYGGYGYYAGYSGDSSGSEGGDSGGGESINYEASYPGNIGMMELAKFFQIANPKQKELFKQFLEKGKKGLAWKLIQDITDTKLQGKEFEEDISRRGFLKGAGAMAAGISAAGGARADNQTDPNKLIAIVNINGESKEFNLTGRFKGDVKSQLHQAEKFITEFLEKRDINFSNLELRYQRAVLKTQNIGSVKEEQGMAENFADGKNPGRKGLAKRSGVNTKASVSSLRKTAKNSSGEKQRMAHWLANMKAGRAKAKRK